MARGQECLLSFIPKNLRAVRICLKSVLAVLRNLWSKLVGLTQKLSRRGQCATV